MCFRALILRHLIGRITLTFAYKSKISPYTTEKIKNMHNHRVVSV